MEFFPKAIKEIIKKKFPKEIKDSHFSVWKEHVKKILDSGTMN